MANQQIIDELNTPAQWGLNNVQRTYTNPGGISRSDPAAIAAIESNAALLNKSDDIEVYRDSIQGQELFSCYTSAALQALSASERDDYAAFIVPMLNITVENPEGLLKSLINDVVFSGGLQVNVDVQNAYEALIRENKSIAQIMGLIIKAGDVQQAMLSLGWIVEG